LKNVNLQETEMSPSRIVLIVEDNPHLSRFYSMSFLNLGFTVIQATRYQQAISQIALFPPDLLLLDLNVPTAADILNWLNEQSEEIRQTRVIAITDPDVPRPSYLADQGQAIAVVIERPISSHMLRGLAERLTGPFVPTFGSAMVALFA
jgi:CheY-like chemotaxis protein